MGSRRVARAPARSARPESVAPPTQGPFAPSRARAIVQYRGVEPLGALGHTAPFWFLDFYDHHAFDERISREVVDGRQAFFARHAIRAGDRGNTSPGW